MEESLRRLKRVRDKNNTVGNAEKDKDLKKEGVSDDNKIRLQLYVDVKHYIKSMDELGVASDEVTDEAGNKVIEALDNLVVEATKTCLDDYLEKLN